MVRRTVLRAQYSWAELEKMGAVIPSAHTGKDRSLNDDVDKWLRGLKKGKR